MMRQWDVSPSIDLNLLRCLLCDLVPDSHDQLFFECAFSSQVWSKVCVLCGMDSIPPWLIDVTTFINPISKGKTAVSILSKLVLAATSYYIWLERNGRLFKKKTSSSDQIVDVIISMVRLKLVTFKFKKMSTRSRLLLDQWKIPSCFIVHDGSSRKDDFEMELGLRVLEEELVPKVEDVSLVNGVFDGAFGGDGEKDVVIGKGVVVASSSLEILTKSCLGRMMVSLIFLEGLEEEA
ncbi:hypothetical protein Tco_0578230 [Tanacetum coccineum]